MNAEGVTSFLTYYVQGLNERTRVEKSGTKYGFDWIVYNLGLSEKWSPLRLPFLRSDSKNTSKTKTENEFGVDLSFLSANRKELIIFVLKDEVLNSKNWCNNSFDIDLRKASIPDLSSSETSKVRRVRVILAYNKDEDHSGRELFDRFTASQPNTIGNGVALGFETWNLTTLVERIQCKLLNPSLLPQRFFSHFSYLCSQFADFEHGSDEWEQQLIPSWRRLLSDLLDGTQDERNIALLPVALVVLREHGASNPSRETGWIDLVEWAMLSAWKACGSSPKKRVRKAVNKMVAQVYVYELHRYYGENAVHLAVPYSIDQHRFGGVVDAVASAVIALWHLARLGLLALASAEILPDKTPEERKVRFQAGALISSWMMNFVNANPSTKRPLLDLHHIELFLVWFTLHLVGRNDDLFFLINDLVDRLTTRRLGHGEVPFLNSANSLEDVFEYAATRQKPLGYFQESSVYLQCLLELCQGFESPKRESLSQKIMTRLVLGQSDLGETMEGVDPIDLMCWLPPDTFEDMVVSKCVAEDGECVPLSLQTEDSSNPLSASERTMHFMRVTRRDRRFRGDKLPLTIALLGCLKHRTPVPPEYWRVQIFRDDGDG